MSDLVEFLQARWAEEEAIAKAAADDAPPPWSTDGGLVKHSGPEEYPKDGGLWDSEGCSGGGDRLCMTKEVSAHVAYWNPARALADIAAKRSVAAIHEKFVDYYGEVLCGRCEDGKQRLVAFPCETTLCLVQPYREHPDFDPSWQ